jgi:uncharacterized coiled-coil DUF342 family protein
MFQDNIFDNWLDTKAKEIIVSLGEGKPLSSEEMMVLVLKAQTNHFNHLDIELRDDMRNLREDLTADMKNLREDLTADMKNLRTDLTADMKNLREDMDKKFEQVDKRFEQVDKRFEQVDKRFDAVIVRMDRFMIWSLGLTFSSTLLILGFMVKLIG